MERPFKGCWRRVRRAITHRNTILRIYGRTNKESLYRFRVETNRDGTGALWLKPARRIPLSISLHLGEALYQLRAALNEAVYVAAIVDSKVDPPVNPGSLEFPLLHNIPKSSDKLMAKIKPLHKKRHAIIAAVQPCFATKKPWDHPSRLLGTLDYWAELDRHRRLHTVGYWGYNISPKITPPSGTKVVSQSVLFPDGGALKNECKIVEFRLSQWVRSVQVHAQCKVAVQVAVDEGMRPLGRALDGMIDVVGDVVRSFEQDTPP